MLIYYATLFGAGLGAYSTLKWTTDWRYLIGNTLLYAAVFALVAYLM